MTYHPLEETHDTGEAYFTSLGLLGGSTGMAPIKVFNSTWPTPDETKGGVSITDSVMQFTGSGDNYVSYELGATYDEVLIVSYGHCSNAVTWLLGATATPLDGTEAFDAVHGYWTVWNTNSNFSRLMKIGPSGQTDLAEDTTIYPEIGPTEPVWGCALYAKDGVQTMWMKSCTGQWFEIVSTLDSDVNIPSFQAVGLRMYAGGASNARAVLPFQIWGA